MKTNALIIVFAMVLAGCGGNVELPTPTISLPQPPAELMVPPQPLKPIPTSSPSSSS